MAKGKTVLHITGFLEILLGVASIGLTIFLLQSNEGSGSFMGLDIAKDALWGLVTIYVYGGLQIVGGLIGLVFGNHPRKAGVCKFFGIVLILATMATQAFHGFTMEDLLYTTLRLLVPAFFYYGAILNAKSA